MSISNGQTIYAHALSYIQLRSHTHSHKCERHRVGTIPRSQNFPSFFLLHTSYLCRICNEYARATTLLLSGETSYEATICAGGNIASSPTQKTDTHHMVTLSKIQCQLTSLSSQGTLAQAGILAPQMRSRLSSNPTAVSHSHLLTDDPNMTNK